jgi:hypothetical protein
LQVLELLKLLEVIKENGYETLFSPEETLQGA